MEKSPTTSRIRYVEALRNQEDYPPGDGWVSITDAARITRTSEAMARRWVTTGRLPIKPGEHGIPPRTRLVRLSDIAEIRPIVDPTAAITGEVRKLDLASIPRQQLHLMQEHQRLLQLVAALEHGREQDLAATRDHLRRELDALEARTNSRQDRLAQALEQQLTSLSEHLSSSLERQQHQLTHHLDELAGQLTNQDQAQQRRLQEESTRLDTERAAQERRLQETHTALQQAQEALDQLARNLQESVTTLQRAIESAWEEARTEATTLIEQQARNLSRDLATLERDQAKDTALLNSQLEQMNATITASKRITESNQQHNQTQEKRIDELVLQLEEERHAHRASEQQLDTLTQRVDALQNRPKDRERRK